MRNRKELSGKEVEVVWACAEEKRGALRRKEGDESRLRRKEERNTYNRRWLDKMKDAIREKELYDRATWMCMSS